MKRKMFLALLIAVALVLGLTGCPTEEKSKPVNFDWTPYVGTWTVYGMPTPYGFMNLPDLGGSFPAGYEFLGTWELTVEAGGNFTFEGDVADRDTTAYGKLKIDPSEPTVFIISVTSGIWHDGDDGEGGVCDEDIPSSVFSTFQGYISREIEAAGTWMMAGEDTLEVFGFRWKLQED